MLLEEVGHLKIIRPIPQEFLWILIRSEYNIVAGSLGNSTKYYLHSFDCFLSFLKYIYEESNYTNFLAHFVYTCVHSCAQMFGGHMLMLDVFHNFFSVETVSHEIQHATTGYPS